MEYYSIKQIAEMKKVSERAVYKQINGKELSKQLAEHKKKIEGKTYIDEIGLSLIIKSTTESPVFYVEDQKAKRIEELEAELKATQQRLDEKDKTIVEVMNSMKEVLERNNKMLDQQAETQKQLADLNLIRSEKENLEKELGSFKKSIFGFYRKREK